MPELYVIRSYETLWMGVSPVPPAQLRRVCHPGPSASYHHLRHLCHPGPSESYYHKRHLCHPGPSASYHHPRHLCHTPVHGITYSIIIDAEAAPAVTFSQREALLKQVTM